MPKLMVLKKKLNEVLLKGKLISEKDLKKALEIQKEKGGQLSQIMVEQKMISQKDLMVCLGGQLGIPPIKLSRYKVDPEVVKLVPERVARHYMLMPVSQIKNVVSVAMVDPLNIFALDDIKALTRAEIQTMITTSDDMLAAIDKYYTQPHKEDIADIVKEVKQSEQAAHEILDDGSEVTDVSGLAKASEEAPIIKMVNVIINEALNSRASDIHLEPFADRVRVRYRIDGILHEMFTLPKKTQNALITRLKIMSNLDITQRRIPQDGRFKVKIEGGKEIDFRVSFLPTSFGGKCVLRALDKANLSVGLEKLGFLAAPLEAFQNAVSKPYGMILVTGPTGSGKSTTLYSVLNQLNTPERNVITVEDPVEYQVERITQIQVRPDIGLTFASGLRSILRQSPDVVMVGEIRDGETADIAIKASLTGQLVLSTLHTNDAATAVTRLIDMGVEPFLIASSLILIVAQRLCRRICLSCREAYIPPKETLEKLGIKLEKGVTVYKSKGCAKCNQTGYHGRMGTLETLVVDDKIREMILKGASSNEIKSYAQARGMKTLRENGIEKFLRGDTSLEEVLRMAGE